MKKPPLCKAPEAYSEICVGCKRRCTCQAYYAALRLGLKALCRAPAEGVSDKGGHTSPGAAGVFEGAAPPVLRVAGVGHDPTTSGL